MSFGLSSTPGYGMFLQIRIGPSRLDGSDTCGNAEVEIYFTDAMFTEFEDFAGVASSSTQSFVG